MKVSFKYARSLCYIMACGAILFFLFPFLWPRWLDPAHTHLKFGQWAFVWSASAGELFGVFYYFKYEVEIDTSALRYGRFSKTEISFSDIDIIRYRKDVRVDAIDVVTKAGRKKTFTSSIDQFGLFWKELKDRTAPFNVRFEQR